MRYALYLRKFNTEKHKVEYVYCSTEIFDGPININDTIIFGNKYKVIDKDADIPTNCYNLYLSPID